MIYSFDVFDTVLTRIFLKPIDLFLKLGDELKKERLVTDSDEWFSLRINSEKKCREFSPTEEISLVDIYEILANYYGWSEESKKMAVQMEIDLELSSIRPIDKTVKQIKKLHDTNVNVIYISDMYLPYKIVKAALINVGVWKDGDSLYVSSQMGFTKSSGSLYKKIMSEIKWDGESWVHVGDNKTSDFQIPSKLGITTNLFEPQEYNRYEFTIYKTTNGSNLFKSCLAGISRSVRLSYYSEVNHLNTIWETSSNLIGPVLLGYVLWILKEAKKKKINRLYFVARDGQILHKIAKIINEKWGFGISCNYIYGSRQAWHFPAIKKIGEEEIEWIFEDSSNLSARSIFKRLNLVPNEIDESFLSKNGLSINFWDDELNSEKVDKLKEILITDSQINDLIIKKVKEYREITISYLKQEGLFDDEHFAIVDVGWRGRLQRSLSILLDIEGFRPISGVKGFYFGLFDPVKAFDNDELFSYFVNPDFKKPRDLLCRYYGNLYEMFCAADHGSTISYYNTNGSFGPIFREKNNEKALKWGLQLQQEAIINFISEVVDNIEYTQIDCEEYLKTAEELLNLFLRSPTKSQADAYGSIIISVDQAESKIQELAPNNLNLAQILLNREKILAGTWLEGMIVRSKLPFSRFFLSMLKLKRYIGKLS